MERDDCFLQYDYNYEKFELDDVGNFLWTEFSIIAGGHFNWNERGWDFSEPNQYNPIISAIISKTFDAMRKEKSPKSDPLERKITNFNAAEEDPPTSSDLRSRY
mgnify:CR=1 FL=1